MGDISFENRNLLAVTKHGCQRDSDLWGTKDFFCYYTLAEL